MSIFSNLFDFFHDLFRNIVNWLKAHFLFLVTLVFTSLAVLVASTVAIFDFVVAAVEWTITATGNLIRSVWNSVIAFVEDAIEWLLEIAGDIVEFIADAIESVTAAIAAGLGLTPGLILAAFGLWLLIGRDSDGNNSKPVN
jgi:phage-related protein